MTGRRIRPVSLCGIAVGLAMVLVAGAVQTTAAFATPEPQKDLCKDGGWRSYGFPNQGQCVSFVNHGGQLTTTLQISKSGPPGVFPGQQFDWTITVTNTGRVPANAVTVTDLLPAAGSFVSSTPIGQPASPAPGASYTMNVGTLAGGASAVETIRWKAPTANNTVVHNSATAQASNAPMVGPATRDVPVGITTSCNPCGAAAAGTGLRNRNHGTIAITGIPAGATVGRAVLVWGILYNGAKPAGTITFAGHAVTADLTNTASGTLCWGDTATVGYAADVTKWVTGNGAYSVTNPPNGVVRVDSNPAGSLPYTDGASLVVFYTGGGAFNQVISDFSYDTNTDADTQINRTFTGINSVGNTASITMAGPDGQNNFGEVLTFTGAASRTAIHEANTWDGSDPQDGPSFPIGNLWDTDRYDVSTILPAGQTTMKLQHTLTTDCIGVGAAVLQVNQAPPVIVGAA